MAKDVAPFSVLYEDNHLLVVAKRAGLPTMGASAGRPSLLTAAKQYIKRKYRKPGNVYLGIVSRLDSPVSGVVVLARTSKAAARLSRQFREGAVEKTYWAIVEKAPRPTAAELTDWLRKDERLRKMLVVPRAVEGARQARLAYRTLRPLHAGFLLEIDLDTGRKHQIRVQLASRGWPILGDARYGARKPFPDGIALHARRLELVHPVLRSPIRLTARPPRSWRRFGVWDQAGEAP